MVSGIPTASGYEERIRFSELEVVESGPQDHGVLHTLPEGNFIHGWDVNVAAVGIKSIKRNIRYHKHAVSALKSAIYNYLSCSSNHQEFILKVRKKGGADWYVGRRYGDFARLHKRLRQELPGRILPALPKKNKQSTIASNLFGGKDDDDASSISSVSTRRSVSGTPDGSTLALPGRGRLKWD